MKPLHSLLCGLVLLSSITSGFAAAPATPPPAAPAPAAKPEDNLPQAATAPAAAPLKLDDYITELTTVVKLSDAEKKAVHDIYTDDGTALQKILNDASLSSLQKAQQVSDLRDARNEKIEMLLHDVDRQHAFFQVEAVYRVSLTESAAEGGLLPPAPPAPEGAAPAAPASPAKPEAAKPAPPATNAPAATPPAPPM